MSAASIHPDPWRLECPQGHRTVRRVRNSHFRCAGKKRWVCRTCLETVPYVTDLKTGKELRA